MPDRIAMNPPEMQATYGDIDEIVVSGCDVHLEQLNEHCFCMVLSRGDEELRVLIFGRGKVHARCEVDAGFAGLREGIADA